MGFVVNWMLFVVCGELEGWADGLWEQKHTDEMAAAAAAAMVVGGGGGERERVDELASLRT